MISFGAGIAERWLAVNVSELEIAVFLVMVKGTTGKLTVGQTVVVASMGKFPPYSEKNYTKQNDQPHQEMNTTNQENELMTYENYKPNNPQLKKKTPIFKQSKHDYTIRSEWSAEAFEF